MLERQEQIDSVMCSAHTVEEFVNRLFEEQVLKTPEAPALHFEDAILSYQDVNERANRLAHFLQAHGVGPEVKVGLYLERSAESIVGLLAILKAGGAYVPLDASFPPDRLEYMAEDIGLTLLLTQQSLADNLLACIAPRIVCLDSEWEKIALYAKTNPTSHVQPANLAYIIFTSGSTGRPKGVGVEHRNIAHYVRSIRQALELPIGARFAISSSLAVDLGNTMIFPALCSGGSLVVLSKEQVVDPTTLSLFERRYPLDCLKIVPSHLDALMASAHPAMLLPRQRLILGGETSSWDFVTRLQALAPDCTIFNHYGPTETTVGALTYRVSDRRHDASSVPIGRPIANMSAYVLDDALQPVAPGVPGELYLAGEGVARGYLNRPGLTAQRFVPHPLSQGEGERLYRTGDLVRVHADGNYEFLGRVDQQVKIRGYRVELEEIEAVINRNVNVLKAVVLHRTDPPQAPRLVAYITPLQGRTIDIDELHGSLQQALPDYMVPVAFVVLDAFPLTPGGKLDRKALPQPKSISTQHFEVEPHTKTEEILLRVWKDVFGLEYIDTRSNFIELGGHSLLATRLIARVRDAFSIDIPLRALFEAATLAELARIIERTISVQQGQDLTAIPLVARDQTLPLSFAQERVWFIHQLKPDVKAYNFQTIFRFRGPLNIGALEQTFSEIIRRHEILRTTFPTVDGRPIQVIHPAEPVELPVVDLRATPASRRENEVSSRIQAFIKHSFHLDQLPLLRWLLMQVDDEEYVLLHMEHHLIHDGWSFNIFLQEMAEIYKGYVLGQVPSLPALPIQFADFAYWQRQWLQGDEARSQLAYWREALAGSPPLLRLPTDHPRPSIQNFRGGQQRVELSQSLLNALKEVSRREGATLYMTMLSAFLVLLHRYSRQDDICIGTSIANRRLRETEGLIGMILNNLVLRTDISGDPTFRALIARVKKTTLDAYAHQDVPFDKVVEAVQPTRNMSHNPLYQVMFNFQDTPLPDFDFPDLTLDLHRILSNGSAKFDMNVTLIPRSEQRRGLGGAREDDKNILVWEYNTDLFDAETVKRLLGQYQTILASVVADSDQRLSHIPLIRQEERQKILAELNKATDTSRSDACYHTLFEECVANNPQAVAIEFEGQQISYQVLNERANQLAHYLLRRNVCPEVRVGIAMRRSLEMVISVLGVLKAGGTYVPLDPRQPVERMRFMLDDANVDTVLTQAYFADQLLQNEARIIAYDRAWPDIAAESKETPSSPVVCDNLAYIIYTSGSTGRPKGTMISHRGLVNYLLWGRQFYRIEEGQGVPVHSSLTFDLTVTSLLLPLLAGQKAVLLPDEQDVQALTDVMQSGQDWSLIKLTPAHLELLNQQLSVQSIAGKTRSFVIGGEALRADTLAMWRAHAPATRLINEYGPTETVVGCCVYEVTARTASDGSVPIGQPIANMSAYVLDDALQPVAPGVPGELYLAGEGVARGYLNRPGLTAQRFVPHPLSQGEGERLYRTGDLVRVHADGNYEFLGRVDQQVKIRGYRVELEEIEAVIAQHASVREVAVQVYGDTSADQRLIAYIVPQQAQHFSANQLREYVKKYLPLYMLPSAFVVLELLPLTSHGKIDRAHLPVFIEGEDVSVEHEFVAPRTVTEEILATVWAEILKVDRVGVRQNFFELGGHSLLATRIVARVREFLQVELPLRCVFEAPTIEELARLVEQYGQVVQENRLPLIVPDKQHRYQPFPLTDIQQAFWTGRNAAFELGNVATQSYREFEIVELDVPRFVLAWHRLIERHDVLRMIVQPDGQQKILQTVPPLPIDVLDLRDKEAEEAELQLLSLRETLIQQMRPSEQWPMFSVNVTLLANRRTRVHLSLDAIMCDAWSRRLLFKELSQFYEDPEAILPPLELSFRDYVLAERDLKNADTASRDYWMRRLPTLAPAPDLPLAKSPASIEHPRFTRRSKSIDSETWKRLKARATRSDLTPSGFLLAAFSEILARWSANQRFTLNLTLFNRLPLHKQINDIAGDFTSLTLLEVDTTTASTFEARARQLQGQLWRDLDHQHFSGVQVLRELAKMQPGAPGASIPVVFTSTLVYADTELGSTQDILGSPIYGVSQTPQVWLDHQVLLQGGRLVLNWDAVEELFPAHVLDDMFDAYYEFLQSLATNDMVWRQATHALVPPAQLADRALVNATDAPLTEDLLHTLFIKQVDLHGKQPAVVSSTKTLTYEALYRIANRIGRWLRQHGALPNTLVAIVMEKGWEQVAASLGVLQAGAAYLPIDARLPLERQSYLLAHGEVSLVLTQSWLDSMSWPDGVQTFCVDDEERLSAFSDEPLACVQGPQDLAYVIYTSGSTGAPKGVMIEHRGAVNTILDMNERFAVDAQDRVLALSAHNFDLSVYDIFGMLAAGGTIVMPDDAMAKDPSTWFDLLVREQVTVWNTVPALMDMLVDYATAHHLVFPPSLRLILMSGDWIAVNLPDRIRAISQGQVQLISMGGATEASIWSILYPIGAVDQAWKSIPYGKPMRNQRFHVLNAALEPCPIWVVGDLYIGGSGLAKGYWRDDEKTQHSFIIHPHSKERLYRTGDRGRYLPDGNIEFMGRNDFQVKVQGYRIELGEIETILATYPGVKTVVVTVSTDMHLMAFVVPEQQVQLTARDLQHFLQAKLPVYMIPSRFSIQASLPLSSNGKVDRKALQDAPTTYLQEERAPNQQTSDTSISKLAIALKQLLGVETLEMDANLLELGANSVDMIRIANLCEKEFAFRPRVNEFYRTPTLAWLTEQYLQKKEGESNEYDQFHLSQSIDPMYYEQFKQQQLGIRHDSEQSKRTYLLAGGVDDALLKQYERRRSYRHFKLDSIALEDLGKVLLSLRQAVLDGKPKYLYASAGGLYPLQAYLYVKNGRVLDVPAGVYYYHPLDHKLVEIASAIELDAGIYNPLVNAPIFQEAAFSIFLIAELQAITPIYGKRSLHYATIEAGLMSQLLETAALEHEIGLCHVGDVDFARIRSLFALHDTQVLIHSLLGGRIDHENPSEQRIQRLLQQVQSLSEEETKVLLHANTQSEERGYGE